MRVIFFVSASMCVPAAAAEIVDEAFLNDRTLPPESCATSFIQVKEVVQSWGRLWPANNQTQVSATCDSVPAAEALIEGGSSLDGEQTPPSSAPGSRRFLFTSNTGGQGAFLYYGSADIQLHTPSSATSAVVTFHGARRNGDGYFCSLNRIIKGQSILTAKNTLLLAPNFLYGDDPLTTNSDLWWNGSKPMGDYRQAGESDPGSAAAVSSFEVVDKLVLHLRTKQLFPKMNQIIFMGHSAGGQLVQRYSLVTQLPALDPVGEAPIRFVVANPSSYTYLNDKRWAYGCNDQGCEEEDAAIHKTYDRSLGRTGWKYSSSTRRRIGYAGLGSAKGKEFICRTYEGNDWSYGLGGELAPYVAPLERLRSRIDDFPARDVAFLVGELDRCSDDYMPTCHEKCWKKDEACWRTLMDVRCPAMLQGWNRNMRAKLYNRHLQEYFGSGVNVPTLTEIMGVGHEAERMFTDPVAQQVAFR